MVEVIGVLNTTSGRNAQVDRPARPEARPMTKQTTPNLSAIRCWKRSSSAQCLTAITLVFDPVAALHDIRALPTVTMGKCLMACARTFSSLRSRPNGCCSHRNTAHASPTAPPLSPLQCFWSGPLTEEEPTVSETMQPISACGAESGRDIVGGSILPIGSAWQDDEVERVPKMLKNALVVS